MQSEEQYLRLTDAQEQLLDYWLSHQLPCGCAPRAAINPGHVRGLLSHISVVELRSDGRVSFRLAGSMLRDIVGMEARGRSVSDIKGGDQEPWCDAILTLLDTRLPMSGVTELGNGVSHVWLRLPLLDQTGELTQIMCHDALLRDGQQPEKRRAIGSLIPQQTTRYAA